MNRRRFLLTSLAAPFAVPRALEAQPATRMPTVGVLWHAGSAEEEAIYLGAFREGLTGLGYIEGKTIRLEHRFPNEQPERFVSQAAELAALKVDLIVAVTRLAALAAQRATTSIPIVFIAVPDPVGTKLVESVARPGGNITGLTQIAVELSAKRLELLKAIMPGLSRAALLVNGNDPQGSHRYIEETQAAGDTLRVAVQPVEVRALSDLDSAFDRVVASRLQAMMVPGDGLFYQGRALIAQAGSHATCRSWSSPGRCWKRARWRRTAPMCAPCSGARRSTSTRSSRAPGRPRYPSKGLPGSSSSST